MPFSSPVSFPRPCPDIFADDVLQTFEIEIAEEHWQALLDDFRVGGQEVDTYRPVKLFKHGDHSTTEAMIRLRGNPSSRNEQQKMQFQISFNEKSPEGRFRGLRKLVLDANHYSKTYLRDRLAMSIARDAGLPAPCVNHARLYVNGQFYGLYGNMEKVDREFLERNFDLADGDLFKSGREQKTNEKHAPSPQKMDAFWRLGSAEELSQVGDLEQMVRAWALESLLPDTDGYWAGGWNFYLYDHPERGLLYLLWDIDQAFESGEPTLDPVTWHKTNTNFNGRPHVQAVLDDPYWRGVFIDELRSIRASIDPAALQARIDRWAAQLRDSAYEDRLAPWTGEEHEAAVRGLQRHVSERLQFVDGWLQRNGGGSDG